MRLLILATVFTILSGCSLLRPEPFPISPKHTVTDIKIEPNHGKAKSVYRPERFV
jgi:hypothetical protein